MSTYMHCYKGLYGSGLFNFGSHLTLFACFLGFDISTSYFIFIGNVFYYSCFHCFFPECCEYCRNTGVSYIAYEIIQS